MFLQFAGAIVFMVNFFRSRKGGEKSPNDAWGAGTLEWSIPSPPPFDNFAGVTPVVNHGPYEYAVPGRKDDYWPQNEPA